MNFRLCLCLKRSTMVLAISLALVITLTYICTQFSSSPILTLLVLIISTYFSFVFSKCKQTHGSSDTIEESLELEIANENAASEDEGEQNEETLQINGTKYSSDSDKQSSPRECLEEDSISDDDSLIEIALPDGHYVDSEKLKDQSFLFRKDLNKFLQDFSPELLSEIVEEDNMIEIDIAVGSIKYSRLEIEA